MSFTAEDFETFCAFLARMRDAERSANLPDFRDPANDVSDYYTDERWIKSAYYAEPAEVLELAERFHEIYDHDGERAALDAVCTPWVAEVASIDVDDWITSELPRRHRRSFSEYRSRCCNVANDVAPSNPRSRYQAREEFDFEIPRVYMREFDRVCAEYGVATETIMAGDVRKAV